MKNEVMKAVNETGREAIQERTEALTDLRKEVADNGAEIARLKNELNDLRNSNAELREGAVAVLDALVELRSFVGAPVAKGTDERASQQASLNAAFFASLPE
jgi:uncharacterized protein YlxW (UPF0749 family)